MPINNLGGVQNIGIQQSNEAGSTPTLSPTFHWGSIGGVGTSDLWVGDPWIGGDRSGGPVVGNSGRQGPAESSRGDLGGSTGDRGLTPTDSRVIGDGTWQAAHASIQPGLYYIRNRAKKSQLVVYHFAQNPRAVVQAFPYHRNQSGPERRWEIRRGGPNPTDLCIVSRFRSERYLTDGPHVFEERNTVRMIPVPQSPDWYYISPNMNIPSTIILDPNAEGSIGPVTTIQLRNINSDIRDAQWQLIPCSD